MANRQMPVNDTTSASGKPSAQLKFSRILLEVVLPGYGTKTLGTVAKSAN